MKKFLSIILSILMVVTMIPMSVLPASAAENLDYNITVEVVDWAVYETSGELIGEFNAVEHGDAFYDVSLTQADDGTFTCSYQIALERNGGNTAWGESSISFKIDSCEDEFMQEFEKSFYSNYNIFYNLKVTRSAGHSFSDWADAGDGTHTRICSVCSETETQNHSFDGGNCLTVGKCDCGLSSIDSNVHTKPVKYVVNSENNFKHDEVYECCGVINSNLDHKYDSKGMCKECKYQCAHSSFTDSICDSCGYNSAFVVIDGTLGGKTTATEDDVNTLVEQLKGYVDSGITTIIVTGSEPALYNFYGIDTSAVSAALYYLADGRSDSPYCGTIDLILPDVTEIVDDEFNNTFALNSITLPKVTTVGDGAFYGTTFLQTLTFGSVITFVNEKNSGPFHMDGYEVGGCDLVLNCGQLQAEDKYKPNFETNVWFIGDWSGEYEWKSITLTHTGGEATCVAKAVCETCGEEYGDIDANAHSYSDVNSNGDGTHSFTCTACHITGIENHTGGTATCKTQAVCEVCGESYGELDKTNHDETVEYTNGFCTECDAYEPAELKDGYYQIKNGGNLFWYANYINTVDRTANAVLTADIDLENRPWTPIGSTGENSNNFRGIFDGQYYNIKGIYVEGDRAGLGFFGEVRTGTVKNFTIFGEVVVNTEVDYVGGVIGSICGVNGETDLERNGAIIQNINSYVNLTVKAHGVGKIGGFVGYANHESLIEQCAWYGTFDAGEYRVDNGAGGFIGRIQENSSRVTIRNCGAYGTIKTNYAGDYNDTSTIYMGGFLSFSNTNAKTTVENCLFAGRFERGENLTDEAFLGAFGTLRSVNAIKNCYYLGDDGLEAVHSDSPLKPGSDNVEITKVTEEQLKSGEVAIQLGELWFQGEDYPFLKELTPHSHQYTYTDNGDGTHDKECLVCDYVEVDNEAHTPADNATYTDNNDGTHSFTCSVCGAIVAEVPHTLDITTGKCSACGADMTAIATVTDSTNTYYAADAATLNQAVTAILETGSRTFTVELPADTEAEMITAIRRAICDTDGVADGSIHLTLGGVTTIPGTTNWDGVAFGPGDIYDEAGEIVDQELVTQLASINLPDATEIGAQAFYFCENLVTVSAPKAQTIGANAFGYTALTSVEFPELTTIPTDMFGGTWTLSSAKFPKVTTIEQIGLLIGFGFAPENNPTPFPLELTAEGDITFNGSNHFNIASQNYSGKVDLVLNIDKKDQVTFNDDGTATWQVRDDLSYTFKSITFTCTDGTTNHSYTYTDNGDGTHHKECLLCDYVEVDNEAHSGGTATCTEQAKCQHCGASYGEVNAHDWSNLDGVCANGCGTECPHDSYTDGVCDKCGYECAHEWDEGVLTRPTFESEGYYTYTCTLCGHSYTEPAKKADDTALNDASMKVMEYIDNNTLTQEAKDEIYKSYRDILKNNGNIFDEFGFVRGDLVEEDQPAINAVTEELQKIIDEAEEKIASGEYVKADYTEIDEAIDDIEEKLASENVTDEGKAELEEIKKQLEEMKADENTSAADVAELEKALEDYEEELDKGIEDGTAVKFDGEKVFSEYENEVGELLVEKYGADFFHNFINKVLGEKFYTEWNKVYSDACALTGGTMAENAENVAQIKASVDELYGKVVNCIEGVHNGFVYEVTEEAKCGVNAIETATCTLCGETDEREVEGTALSHSFTKYEETEAPKCGVAGKERASCDHGCGATDEKEIEALEHADKDGDLKCDHGCGYEFEQPVDPEQPDTPDEPEDPSENCDHLCHKSGFLGFIWKIVQFFSKLFKINPVCECGAAHY